jgi:hypothetical protein
MGTPAKRNRHTAIKLGTCLVLTFIATPTASWAGIRNVDCNKGETIGEALTKAEPGDTIRVTGTCRKQVTITKDRLTLDGQGTAILDGGGGASGDLSGLLTIDGARGVMVTGFTIQNGPSDGILAVQAATFTVKTTTVQNNVLAGIMLTDQSTAELSDFTTQRNHNGISVLNASLVILRENIIISGNQGDGGHLVGQSIMEIRGAHVQATNNLFGLAAISGQLVVYDFTASQGSSITASNNRFAGIGIGTGSFQIFGRSAVTAENNGSFGLFCPAGGKLVDPFGQGTFVFRGNSTAGMFFSDGCSALVTPAMLTVQNNGTGLLADAADTVTFTLNPPNGSAITGNGTDVVLTFGTRATIQGITVGKVSCPDKTVLSRGTAVCP